MDSDTLVSQNSQSSENSSGIITTKITINGWTDSHEEIFYEWADKAMCYRWLHSRSFNIYSWKAAAYTIPVIIMSTITGTANFAQDKFPEEYKTIAQMSIGAINIIAGILTTIQQYFKVNELNEAHRVSSISWGKFHQNIKVEMTKNPKDRKPPMDMLNAYKEEFDRLLEISPNIEDSVIKEFKLKFGKKSDSEIQTSEKIKQKYNKELYTILDKAQKNTDKPKRPSIFDGIITNKDDDDDNMFKDLDKVLDNYVSDVNSMKKQMSKNKFHYLKKPDICDELVSISDTKRNWYLIKEKKDDNNIVYQENPEAIEMAEKRKAREIYRNQIESFVYEYKQLKGQNPLIDDIIDNKKDSIPMEDLREISMNILKQVFNENNINNI
tara:strand:- start:218 stop:1363 length:1146 start_codon:yes stop_codon:yes gene_type:complete